MKSITFKIYQMIQYKNCNSNSMKMPKSHFFARQKFHFLMSILLQLQQKV